MFDTVMKLLRLAPAVEGTMELGYPHTVGSARSSSSPDALSRAADRVRGAVVMTGYLGGAVATHVRITRSRHTLFPIYVAAMIWGGLYLREPFAPATAIPNVKNCEGLKAHFTSLPSGMNASPLLAFIGITS